MSSIKVAGQASDFGTDPNITIMQILSDNWPAGGASGDTSLKKHSATERQGVKIGTDWWDGNPWYQIHVRPVKENVKVATLGVNRWVYQDLHDVHIFAKGENGKDKLWKLEKEVMNQLLLKANAPGTGISWMDVDGPREVPDEDAQSDIYHAVILVSLFYHKIKS